MVLDLESILLFEGKQQEGTVRRITALFLRNTQIKEEMWGDGREASQGMSARVPPMCRKQQNLLVLRECGNGPYQPSNRWLPFMASQVHPHCDSLPMELASPLMTLERIKRMQLIQHQLMFLFLAGNSGG